MRTGKPTDVGRLYYMAEDGRFRIPLTPDDGISRDCGRLSPGQRKMAYVRGTTPDCELVVLDLATGTETVAVDRCVYLDAWTPDGADIVFTEFTGCSSAAYRVRADGTSERSFLDPSVVGDVSIHGISFSRDGSQIAWASQDGCWSPTLEVYRADYQAGAVVTSSVVRLTNDGQLDIGATFSADGSLVYFAKSEAGIGYGAPYNVFRVDVDGTRQTKLTSNASGAGLWPNPLWWVLVSPDGSDRLAFSKDEDGVQADVWVMDSDGANQRNLTDTPTETEIACDWLDATKPLVVRRPTTPGQVMPQGPSAAVTFVPSQNQILLFGGVASCPSGAYDYPYTGVVNAYDVTSNTWSQAPGALPYAALGTQAALATNGNVYIGPMIGPTLNNGWGIHLAMVEYDPRTGASREVGNFGGSIWNPAAITHGDEVLVFGGWTGSPSGTIRSFDPASGTLTTLAATLPEPANWLNAQWGANGQVFLLCGPPTASHVQVFDPDTHAIRVSAAQPADLGSAVWRVGPTDLFIGSPTGVYRFDTVTEAFEAVDLGLPSAALQAMFGLAVNGPDGRVFVIGGPNTPSGTPCYDTQVWELIYP
jgi:hypothetical protein